ncbi:MAG: fructosamine kinase family protein [Bacteroidota bacterium]
MKPSLEQLGDWLGEPLKNCRPIAGGDSHAAYRLEGTQGTFFLKYSPHPEGAKMLAAEADGLRILATEGGVQVPQLFMQREAYLLLDFIEQGQRTKQFWQQFGRELARLHSQRPPQFGTGQANYIGQLPQANGKHARWPDFYCQECLLPQLELARSQNLLPSSVSASFDRLFPKIGNICPKEPPALVHGDLWAGNFLCNLQEEVVFIDPAISYAHREMDIAMSRLFGGFSPLFYDAYQEAYPLKADFDKRCGLYQLYYLLVHVNLFGQSYLPSVRKILEDHT